jgi:hypothetical protein
MRIEHLGPQECPLCWRFDCQCWRVASGMEARQGGNEVPSRSDDSPTAEGGDAHTEGDR